MQVTNRKRKTEPKIINSISLNEEQKEAKRLIIENQIVVITGRAGSGKSLVSAQAALSFLINKECKYISVTRATIEVGKSLGFLPGELDNKFNPYIEAFVENLIKCTGDKVKIEKYVKDDVIKGFPLQFVRGKTVEDVLIVEEAQNLSKHEILAVLTRLGKTGKIIINGDNDQMDIKHATGEMNGLSYILEMANKIKGVKTINLKENHRSGLVGEILDYEYNK
jgi:predicted ribonuclease YlaK